MEISKLTGAVEDFYPAKVYAIRARHTKDSLMRKSAQQSFDQFVDP